MSIENCLGKLKTYLTNEYGDKRSISDSKMKEFARQLEMRGQGKNPGEFANIVSDLIENEMQRQSANAKAAKASDLLKMKNSFDTIKMNEAVFRDQIEKGKTGLFNRIPGLSGLGDKPEDASSIAFMAKIRGGEFRAGGLDTNMSIEKMTNQEKAKSLIFQKEAFTKEIRAVAEGGTKDKEMWIAKWALDQGKSLQNMDEDAIAYAKAMKASQNQIFQVAQSTNPFLEKADGWLAKNFHVRERILADRSEQGKLDWINQMHRTYDAKSFPDNTFLEKHRIYLDMYDKIADGRWGTLKDDADPEKWSNDRRGAGWDLLRAQSHQRYLIPEDGEKFWEYQSKYGPKTAYEGLQRSTTSAANLQAKLSKWTSTPEPSFEALYNKTLNSLKGEDRRVFEGNYKKFKEAFDISMGSMDRSAGGSGEEWTRDIMSAQYIAHGSLGVLRSLPDMNAAALMIRSVDGKNIFQHMGEIASEVAKNFVDPSSREEALHAMHMLPRSAQAEMMKSMGHADSQPGNLTKMAQLMGSLTMHNQYVDSVRAGVGNVMGRLLGSYSHLAHGELPLELQQSLPRWKISPDAWFVIRSATELKDGKPCVTAQGVQNISDTAAEVWLRKSKQYVGKDAPSARILNSARNELSGMVGTMVNELADQSTMLGDERQRAFLLQGSNIGTWQGKVYRLATQFLRQAIVNADTYRRAYLSGTALKGDMAGVAMAMTNGVLLSGLGTALRQYATGKIPHSDYFKSKDYIAETLMGAGWGTWWGDALVNSATHNGDPSDKFAAYAKSFMGPTLTDVGNIVAGGATYAQGKMSGNVRQSKKGAMALVSPLSTLATGLGAAIPGVGLAVTAANSPPLKPVLEFYIKDHIKNWVDPSWKYRYDRGVKKGGEDFWAGKPTGQGFMGMKQ